MVSFVGVYSLKQQPLRPYLMIGFGVFGYLLRKLDISLVPVVLGLLLGNSMEFNLRRALEHLGRRVGHPRGQRDLDRALCPGRGDGSRRASPSALVRQRGEKTGGGFEGP